jgi:hypothetical protein
MVHVSIVGFDNGTEEERLLDGFPAQAINASLAVGDDAVSVPLPENKGISFMGDTKGGAFDIEPEQAATLLKEPNASGKSNSDVVRPWVNGSDVTKRNRGIFIIDFGCEAALNDAARYEAPLRYVEQRVKPERVANRRESYAKKWWLHVEPRPAMREALSDKRYLVTPNVSKHRLFAFLDAVTLPDHQVIAFARSDDYFFGVLQSSVHELFARRPGGGTQLREAESGFRYTPSSTFETFPLPWPPGKEDVKHPAYKRIAEAAKSLNEQRERWLNPPGWIEQLAAKIDAADTFADVPKEARPLIRQSAIMAAAAKDDRLKKRTLTNLYNERPTWLKLAHEQLDRAVLAAYAATDPEGDWSEGWAEVWTDTGAGQLLPADHPLAAKRAEVDQKVLANLLRLNHARSKAGEPPTQNESEPASPVKKPRRNPNGIRAARRNEK